MRSFLIATALATLGTLQAQAQSEAKLPELPAPAGNEPSMPALPAPTSTYDTIPTPPSAPMPAPRQMSQEEIERLKQDENWLVEGMKKKQEDDAAAEQLRKATEMDRKKEDIPKESDFKPGELSGFKPVLANTSLSSLNANQEKGSNPADSKKKSSLQDTSSLDGSPVGSNPLTTSNSSTVQPILGPSRQKTQANTTNANVANLNPGVGIAPLPGTGIKKISSNTNFVPEGYADSWTKQQQEYNGLKPANPQLSKPLAPAAPANSRPTFRDLANTIPDPTQVR